MEIKLLINGIDVPLTEFPKEIIIRTILGMLSALRGVKDVKSVEIHIK